MHHDTVRLAVEADRFAKTGTQIRPTLLDPYKGLVGKILEDHPKLRATRIFEMVKARGYLGSVVQVRRYVCGVRPSSREAFLRLETMPGEQAQVDWGHFGKIRIGSATRVLSCFVIVLSWSRAIYARFALDQTLESFMRGHILGFAALGGVPREILYDNLKSVVLERAGDHIRFHPRLDLAGHYHFAPKPCAPYRGNEKGKVERQIQYLRHSFFAARRFSTVDDLNRQLARWIADIAHVHDLRGRDLLRTVCKHADELLDALALRGEHIGGHTARLIQLLRQVGAAELDRAMAEALARGATGAGSVAHLLDQRARARKQLPALETVLPDDPRVRDLRVTPHALARYDDLYAKPSPDEEPTL